MDLRISLDNHDNDGQPREHDNVRDDIENVTTGEGNDLIIGSAKSNVLDGVFGNDTIIGGAGPDTLIGGPGDDELLAKDGFVDVVNGVDGNDRASVDNGKVKDQVLNVEVFI
jgi:Ca2+-binding RTX toxin-like protein